MFSIKNNVFNQNSYIVATYESKLNNAAKDSVEFNISTIISKRNKQELEDPNQFLLLNAYIDYKGEDFKAELFNRLRQADYDLKDKVLFQKGMHPLPSYIVNPVLDMFTIEDVRYFLKEVWGLQPPKNLADFFDPKIESDSKGTRVQTYIKDDYMDLAAFVVILKSVIGIIGTFAEIKNKEVNSIHKEFLLYQLLYQNKHIFQSEPAEKLLGLIDKVVNQPVNSLDIDSIRIIEKQLPRDDIPVSVMAIVVLQKLPICAIVDDNHDKNIITKVYNYVNNKLKSPGNGSKGVQEKKQLSDTQSRDKESTIESTKIPSKIPEGIVTELSWSIDSVDKILKQLPKFMVKYIDRKVLEDAMEFSLVFKHSNISKPQISILGSIFKYIIDPRVLEYLELECMLNLLAVGFAYLWGINHKQLAIILLAREDIVNYDDLAINMSSNKPRISSNVKDELGVYFPYCRVVNETTTVLVIEESISHIAYQLLSSRWIHSTSNEYIEEAIGNNNPVNILPPDLKLKLATFFIDNERIIYDNIEPKYGDQPLQ